MTHHAQQSEDYRFTYENNISLGQQSLYNTLEPHLQDINQSLFSSLVSLTGQPNPSPLNRQDKFAALLKRLSNMDLPNKEEIEEYLRDQHRRHCRPGTIIGAFGTIILFLSFMKGRGKFHMAELTRGNLESWVEHEQDRGIKPSTLNMRLRTLKAFIRFLIERDIVDHKILNKRLYVKVPDTLPRAMDPEDEKKMIGYLGNVRERAMIMVLLRTGMRVGELLNTLVSEINLKDRRIEIYEAEKTRVGRVVYLSDDATRALKAWLRKRKKNNAYLFYGRGDHPLSYQGVRLRFIRLLEAAGIEDRGYSMHSLRHTFATDLLNAGMRLECLQQLLGHSSIEMTRRYARLTDKTREEEYFRAMSIIERGDTNVDIRFDHQLQTAP